MVFVDTNIIIRWLLGDHPELSAQAEKIVKKAGEGGLVITDVVVAEIVYVLRGAGYDRHQTTEALLMLERTPAFHYESPELVLDVVRIMGERALDFADCYLLVRARRERTGLETFDKALLKLYKSK